MDRLQDRAMCYIPQNQNNQSNSNEFNLNIEIKQEIPDIDFEEEKIGDTNPYDDGFHLKCGEIYINNINKEFSLYCSLCNANFINFNLFSHHILFGNHGNQLFFFNNNYNTNSNNNNNNNNQHNISQLCNGRKTKLISNSFQTNINQKKSSSPTPTLSSTECIGISDIETIKPIKDVHQSIEFNTDELNENSINNLESFKCNTCWRKFQSNRELKSHIQIYHSEGGMGRTHYYDNEKKTNRYPIENIVSVATFSLAVCSTPIEKNEPNIRRTRSYSYENSEIGKTKRVTESTSHKQSQSVQDGFNNPLSTFSIKESPKYAVKSTTPIIITKSSGIYSASNKYTGSTIPHGISKISSGPVIKASATIAEISNIETSEEININAAPEQIPGSCPYCPVKFQKMKYLNFHLQKYHPEKMHENEMEILESGNCYKCEFCKMIFRRLDFYKKHMRKHPRNRYKSVYDGISLTLKKEKLQDDKDIKNMAILKNEYLVQHEFKKELEKQDSNSINPELFLSDSNIEDINFKKNLESKKPQKSKNKSKKKLKCQYCGKTVLKLYHLILHERKHKAGSSVKCRVCEQRYYIRSTYENHMNRHHPEVEYELTEDEIKQLSWRKNLVSTEKLQKPDHVIQHQMEKTETPIVKSKSCSFCPKIFKTVEYRVLHEKAHTGTGNFTCKYCEQKFNSIGTLWSHQRNCFKKLEDENIEVRETRLRSEKREKEKLDDDKKGTEFSQLPTESIKLEREKFSLKSHFKCTYCKKLFTRKSNWVDHVRKHTGEKFECNICDYKTTSPFYLKSHMLKIHDYSKANKSITKEKESGNAANLNTAIEVATKTSLLKSKLLLQSLAKFDSITSEEKAESFIRLKLFKCKFCQEVYTKKYDLEEHLKTHLKSKQINCFDLYKCKYCNLRYKFKCQKMLHERRHDKEKLFNCDICKINFISQGYLSYHKIFQHKIGLPIKLRSVLKCQSCEKVFRRLKNLRTHENLMHNENDINLDKENEVAKSVHMNDKLSYENCQKSNELEKILPESNQIVDNIKEKATIEDKSITFEQMENPNDPNWKVKEQCKICRENFDNNYLTTHMKIHKIDKNRQKCDFCDRTFKFKSNLIRHTLADHNTTKFPSPNATSTPTNKSKKITIRTLLKENKIPTINGPPFECPHESCSKSFGRRTGFNKHYLLHLDTFKCKYCNRCFQTKKVLQKHINFHIENLPYKCKTCSKAFPVKHALIWHKRRNNCGNPLAEESSISYDCEKCSKSFISKSSLSQHLLEDSCVFVNKDSSIPVITGSKLQEPPSLNDDTKISEMKPKCDSCGKIFLSPAYLAMHYKKTNCVSQISIHNDVDLKDNIESDVRSNDSSNSSWIHTQIGDSKYICKICSKKFKSKLMLSWHTRRRTCKVSSESYESKDEEDNNKNENSPTKDIANSANMEQTKIIPEDENQNTTLQTDENIDNKKEQYQCEVCLRIFVVKGFLLRHMKYYHPPLIEKDCVKEMKENNNTTNDIENTKTENVSTEITTDIEENYNRRSTRKRIENEDIKFQCQICLKKFETKGLLAGHTRTKACFKSSSCMSTLRAQKSPTKDGNDSLHKCNLCNKIFTTDGHLTNHMRNQVCIIKKENQNITLDNSNNVQSNNDENSTEVNNTITEENKEKCTTDSNENKIESVLEGSNTVIDSYVEKYYTCKKCNKQFPTKVSLAWHTRRKECFYKRKKFKVKTAFGLNPQATKIRKKFIEGIVSSRKVSAERLILQKKIRKAAIQVYKHNKTVTEMANKYHISKTIIYRKLHAFKSLNESTADCNIENLVNSDPAEIKEKVEDNEPDPEIFINEQNKIEDHNKTKPKIDLGVLRNEKDKNMVRAIRNYIRDRKKGTKLPQRFYCDRYQIRKIHFYRKLFKLGMVRKKGKPKRDPENNSSENLKLHINNDKVENESQSIVNKTSCSSLESDLSHIHELGEHKRRKGRKPNSPEELVRKAVMDYRMGKGTQLEMCEKYQVGIWSFHRVKKIVQDEMPDLKFPTAENDEIIESKTMENIDSTSILEDNSSQSATKKSVTNLQLYKINKTKRRIKMMKTSDLRKRRLEMLEACGGLISNRKSKYNIPGTKENATLMDAISDIVTGVRAFSNAVKHYKISFYTLQRYLKKYKEKMSNKKSGLVLHKKGNLNLNKAAIDNNQQNTDVINKKSLSLISSNSISSSSDDESSSDSESETKSKNDKIIKKSIVSNNDTSKNISSNSNSQERTVFDPVTGQYVVRKKFQGRGGRGKMRQTVYSKPGTKENKILMEAINEIRNKGKSIGHVSRKFQISIQTVSKYIDLFEKQGVLAKTGGLKKDKSEKIKFSENMESKKTILENQGSEKTDKNIQIENSKSDTNETSLNDNKNDENIKSDLSLPISTKTNLPDEKYSLNLKSNSDALLKSENDSNNSAQNYIANDLVEENVSECTKQNVLKENSISSTKKEVENFKDSIRKPTYITQKLTTSQCMGSDNVKNRTVLTGQTSKQSENIQKDNKLIKSTIEIRKPTYLTQKLSTPIVKILETKQTPSLSTQSTEDDLISKNSELIESSKISGAIESKILNDNLTVASSISQISNKNSPNVCPNVSSNETLKSVEIEKPEPHLVKSEVVDNIQKLDEINKKNDKEMENNANKIKIGESMKMDKDSLQKKNSNIKFRKPTYITQKSIPLNTSNKNKSEDIPKQQTIYKSSEQIKQIYPSITTQSSNLCDQKTDTIKLNKINLDRQTPGTSSSSSSSVIKSRDIIIRTTTELRDQTITEFLNAKPNEIEIQPEMYEDDLIIEHAMRSLLEQDAELDLGNVESLANKTEIKKSSYTTGNSSNSNSNDSNTSTSTGSSSNCSIDLGTSTKSLTTAYKILNECEDCDDNVDQYENTSNFQSG